MSWSVGWRMECGVKELECRMEDGIEELGFECGGM